MALVICPDCNREISDSAPACVHCGRPNTSAADRVKRVPTLPANQNASCGSCDTLLDSHVVWDGGPLVCPGCAKAYLFERRGPPAPTFNRGVAAVLSLVIPGAGQMYRGSVGAGLVWLICTVLGYMMFVVPGVILHIACIFSAASGGD